MIFVLRVGWDGVGVLYVESVSVFLCAPEFSFFL